MSKTKETREKETRELEGLLRLAAARRATALATGLSVEEELRPLIEELGKKLTLDFMATVTAILDARTHPAAFWSTVQEGARSWDEHRAMAASRLSTTAARSSFSELINRVAYRGERVVLERRGQPAVAVIPVDDLKLLVELEDRIDLVAAREALAEAQEKGTIPWEKLKADVGL